MKNLFLLIILFFSSTLYSYSITELTTEYDYKVRGFIVADTGVKVRIKLEDQKEFVFSKAEIKDLKELRSEINMTDGSSIKTNIIDMTGENITVSNNEGISKISRDEILSIKHIEEKDDVYNYFLFGGSAFSPNDVNAVFGYQTKYIGFRAAAGTDFQLNTATFQANLLYSLYKDRGMEHNISIGYGINKKYYIGIFYDINIAGFFAEVGYAEDSSFTKDIQKNNFKIQLGYVYRFTR